jgi:hypothetical protein
MGSVGDVYRWVKIMHNDFFLAMGLVICRRGRVPQYITGEATIKSKCRRNDPRRARNSHNRTPPYKGRPMGGCVEVPDIVDRHGQ